MSDVTELVIVEGCFGETSAALQALDAADSAEDPAIVAAYGQIARDERRVTREHAPRGTRTSNLAESLQRRGLVGIAAAGVFSQHLGVLLDDLGRGEDEARGHFSDC